MVSTTLAVDVPQLAPQPKPPPWPLNAPRVLPSKDSVATREAWHTNGADIQAPSHSGNTRRLNWWERARRQVADTTRNFNLRIIQLNLANGGPPPPCRE